MSYIPPYSNVLYELADIATTSMSPTTPTWGGSGPIELPMIPG